MPITARFTLRVPPLPLLNHTASEAILRREVGTAMQGIVEDIASEARLRTPVNTGILRASIATRVSQGRDVSTLVQGEVFTGSQAPYAIYVEQGRRPGSFPPWGPGSALAFWVQRVLGANVSAFVIARAIARRGIPARRMFAQALERVRPSIEPRLQAALDRVARLLGGSP